MSDLEIIASIEKIIGKKLTVCPPDNEVMDWRQGLSYKVDEQQQVIGLNLWYCGLVQIDFLKALPNLTKLELGQNYLSDISVLEFLPNLTYLGLWDNQLSDISVLEFLPNLTYLGLSDNQISDISVLKYLPNLTHLHLENNHLNDLDPLISLTKLKFLDLRRNEIQVLPEWLLNFKLALKWENDFDNVGIYLAENPFVQPPIEIVKQGKEAIRSYYQQLKAEGEDYIYEAKLILVGEAGAGKTSLANKILDPAYQLVPELDSKSTEGIEILRHDFPFQQKSFRVNIWDFGGQEIYHQTHKFFLSKRSLYFLVVDNRKEDTDFYYWLNVIQLLTDNSPLLIVNNQKCDRSRSIPEQLRVEFSNIREILDVNIL